MKKLFLIAGLMVLFTQVFSQGVQRNQVVMEIGTGTWCTYCPGAANGAHDLLINGCHVAVIENHNGDAFANSYSNARNTYYGISGYPTAFFDGVSNFVGGAACPNGNVYSSYLPIYNTRYAVLSPLVIDIAGTNNGNTYDIVLSIKKVATLTSTDLKVHLVLTESSIATAPWPGSGGCMTEVNHVNRIMVPNELGTPISFGSGDMQIITLSFTKDAAWVAANCELVAFVQDAGTKETFNGSKVALTALPAPVAVDFSGTPTNGCSPLITNFSDLSSGVTNWQWEFQGGTPGTSTTQNPSITYNTGGTYNVTLTAWNNSTNRGNKKVKTGYITVTGTPGTPGQPAGPTSMCVNSVNSTYTTTGTPGATSYNWDLNPAGAGVITNNGTSCTIDWDNAYTGNAQLKVQGSSSCGTGPWSSVTTISITSPPPQPAAPTGPTQLCMNPPNTDYTTTGSAGATSYQWEVTPSNAGTVTSSTTTATVYWTDTYVGAVTLKVSAFNGGCQGPWSDVLNITISDGPAQFSMTGGGTYCAVGGTGVEVGLSGSESAVDYTLFFNGSPTSTVVSGTGGAISFGLQTGAGNYTAQGAGTVTSCTNMMAGTSVVNVDPQAPNAPGAPTGPGTVYTGSNPTADYVTTGGTYATSYSWELTPPEAGTMSGTTTTGTATWDQSYEGPAMVKVQGVNTCGGGTYSTEFTVDVHPGFVGIGENSKRFFSVYPNPVKGILTIASSEPRQADITVISPQGQTVLTKNGQTIGKSYQLDLTGLSSGVYMITLKNSDGVETIKIVVR